MTAAQYIGWVRYDLLSYQGFKLVKREFPELWGKARIFDEAVAINRMGRYRIPGAVITLFLAALAVATRRAGVTQGTDLPVLVSAAAMLVVLVAALAVASVSTVLLCFKAADDLPMMELMADLGRVKALIPSPGAVDAFEYYGALVLVFEKPLASAKRDKLISMRQASPLGRMVTDLWIVELDAGTIYALDVPWTIRKFVPPLQDVIGRKNDAPPVAEPAEVFGQRGARTGVAWVTLGLIAFMTVLHVGLHTVHAETIELHLLRAGAESTKLVQAGEWWRLITSMYLHISWDHIGWNLVIFFELSRGVEQLFGSAWTMALFVLTGLLANLVSIAAVGDTGLGLGASGAICGSGGILIGVLLLRSRNLSVRYRSHLYLAGIMLVRIIYMGFAHNPLNAGGNWAHLGGALAGLPFGLFLPFKGEEKPSPWRGALWGAAATALTVIAWGMVGLVSWNWQPAEFTTWRSPEVRAIVEVPDGWWGRERRGHGEAVVTNWLGAGVQFDHGYDDIAGIFEWPAYALRDYIYGKARKMRGGEKSNFWRYPEEATVELELKDLEPSFTTFAEGKALRVTYRLATSVTIWHYFLFPERWGDTMEVEDYFLPLKEGYLHASFLCQDRDREYYRPIFGRIRNTLKTMEQPADWIPKASTAPSAGAAGY